MSAESPKVTFGLPVRNGEKFIGRAIDSLLAQTCADIEVLISDNQSTDRTREICLAYAERDPRVRFHQNQENIGVLGNFNQLVGLGRGEYFRWLGSDDWLEPEYAAECVAALEANPESIAATTFQVHIDDQGDSVYREYTGQRVDSEKPHRRFSRMLWFLQQEHWLMDANFSMYRRDVLARTKLHRPMAQNDRILAAELSLLGPYCHVPRKLSNRRRTYETAADVNRKIRPPGSDELDLSAWIRFKELLSVIRDAGLTPFQSVWCQVAAAKFYWLDIRWVLRQRIRRALASVARRAGLSRTRQTRIGGAEAD